MGQNQRSLRDTMSDTWAAVDGLGRRLPDRSQVGAPRRDRTVAMFYFLWHGEHVSGGPYDITKILARDPGAMLRPDSPLWGPMYAPHHWGESLFGYYLTNDAYVLRKHAQMLSDAGVDAIIFDVTNQVTYKKYYMELLRVFSEVRAAGGRTPQVAFLCPFWDPGKVARELYADLYAPGIHPDLWFRWDGKPLILADPDLLATGVGTSKQNAAVALEPGHTLAQAFTVTAPFDSVGARLPTWSKPGAAVTLTLRRVGPRGGVAARRRLTTVADSTWNFLRFPSPQPPGAYVLEISEPTGTVGWWSHNAEAWTGGQAYADGVPAPGSRTLRITTLDGEDGKLRSMFTFRKPQPDYFEGPTRPDMWSWLEIFPQHMFHNSRGEREQMSVGVAQNAVGRKLATLSQKGSLGRSYHAGATDTRPDAVRQGLNFAEQFEHALKADPRLIFVTGWNEWIAGRFAEFNGVREPVMFVDQFSHEGSRDIEPMLGGHGDDYYYQLVSYIRRYKGVRPIPRPGPPATITIDGRFDDWAKVRPEYLDDAEDQSRRSHPAWNNVEQYTNTTGRNDLLSMKVARDAEHVFFYVRTREPISPCTDSAWMWLMISTGGSPNWEGFDYLVNRGERSPTASTLERCVGGWNWSSAGRAALRVTGCEMEMAVRRVDLGLKPGAPIRLQFKWADNVQKPGEVMEFLLNGDTAPNGRFTYRYED